MLWCMESHVRKMRYTSGDEDSDNSQVENLVVENRVGGRLVLQIVPRGFIQEEE